MSEYFRVLKRIESDHVDRERPEPRARAAESPARAPTSDQDVDDSTDRLPVVYTVAPPADGPYATLFENLRALTNGRPLRCLVFAGVSAAEPVHSVVAGLTAHLEGRGLEVLRAELTETAGRCLLRRHRQELTDGGGPLQLDLHGHDWDTDFSNWLHCGRGGPDLAIIEGRPLAPSIDSALLARACDGLVIVARREQTRRDDLQAAAARARAAGCVTLGVVVHGAPSTTTYTAGWLRRVMASIRRTQPKLED